MPVSPYDFATSESAGLEPDPPIDLDFVDSSVFTSILSQMDPFKVVSHDMWENYEWSPRSSFSNETEVQHNDAGYPPFLTFGDGEISMCAFLLFKRFSITEITFDRAPPFDDMYLHTREMQKSASSQMQMSCAVETPNTTGVPCLLPGGMSPIPLFGDISGSVAPVICPYPQTGATNAVNIPVPIPSPEASMYPPRSALGLDFDSLHGRLSLAIEDSYESETSAEYAVIANLPLDPQIREHGRPDEAASHKSPPPVRRKASAQSYPSTSSEISGSVLSTSASAVGPIRTPRTKTKLFAHTPVRSPRNSQSPTPVDGSEYEFVFPEPDGVRCPISSCAYVQRNQKPQDLKRHIKSHFTHQLKERGMLAACCGMPVSEAERFGLSLDGAQVTTWSYRKSFSANGGTLAMVGGCGKTFARKDAYLRHLHHQSCRGDGHGWWTAALSHQLQ